MERKERNRARKERRIAKVALRVQRVWRSKRFRRRMETRGLQRGAAIILQAAARGLIARQRVCRWLRGDLEREVSLFAAAHARYSHFELDRISVVSEHRTQLSPGLATKLVVLQLERFFSRITTAVIAVTARLRSTSSDGGVATISAAG